MSDVNRLPAKNSRSLTWIAGGIILVAVALVVATLVLQTPGASSLSSFLQYAFATSSVQTMWYITRAAGMTAYLLFWLSTAWGLAVSSKILDNLLHRSFTYDFHQFLSLLAIGFTGLHIVVLMFDKYLPYSLTQILVPFLSPYRPFWIGLGVIALYLTLLVTITFYLRGRIGMKAFRVIHVFSLLAYLGVLVHSVMSGSDSSLTSVLLLYAGTFLATVFLMTYWIYYTVQKNRKKKLAIQKDEQTKPSQRVVTSYRR
jgi:sulfoxide reductase heme-binding subunit YedZ